MNKIIEYIKKKKPKKIEKIDLNANLTYSEEMRIYI